MLVTVTKGGLIVLSDGAAAGVRSGPVRTVVCRRIINSRRTGAGSADAEAVAAALETARAVRVVDPDPVGARAVRPGGAWTARPFQEPGTVWAAARVAIWVRDA